MKQGTFGISRHLIIVSYLNWRKPMSVETVGSLPPEADQVRSVLEQQLPEIISSFNQVLRDQYGMVGISVGGFTVVPESAVTSKVTCDQDGCSVS